jgi:hypothetical protein
MRGVLAAFVRDHPRQRIGLDELRAHLAAADPASVGDPRARQHLLEALQGLADAGELTLPARRRGNWDERSDPPLPAWVNRPSRPKPAPRPPSRVWPAVLEPAAALARRPDELALLEAIARWLREDPEPVRVPVEERSLQLLGHEKALGPQLRNRLFQAGALSLELLACYPTPLPFASQHVPGAGPTRLLVSENNAGYHSLLTAARAHAAVPDLHLAWGGGKQFPVGIEGVALLRPRPAALLYLGDLDLDGLRIAVAAARRATALELPSLQPAAPLYRALRDHGVPQRDSSNPGTPTDHDRLLAWLPADLREFAADLLAAGERIAQETVGLRLLLGRPELLSAL